MSGDKYDKPIDKINLKGSSGIGILRLTNFYIQQSRCGATWTLMRLRADEQAALGDFGFVDFDEEEKSESKPKAKATANVGITDSDEDEDDDTDKKGGNAEDDSEDEKPAAKKESEEEEDSDEEEEEPEPVPVVKKGAKKAPAATTATKKK
jgi:hypothetical protein